MFESWFLDYHPDVIYKKLRDEFDAEARLLMSAFRSGSSEEVKREAYFIILLRRLDQAKSSYADGYFDNIERLLNLKNLLDKNDFDRRNHLKNETALSLQNLAIDLSYYAEMYKVIPMTYFSERRSAETEKLRSINPTIWDTGVNVMRYAAFFRYCKAKYPSQWQSLLTQLHRVSVSPQVQTPTIMERKQPGGKS